MNASKVHEKWFNPKCIREIHLTMIPRCLKSSRIHLFMTFESLLGDLELSFYFHNKTGNFT